MMSFRFTGEQVGACLTFLTVGLGEDLAELPLEHTVYAADFLLLTQLRAIARQALSGRLAVLAGSIGAALHGTLVGKALFALEEEFLSLAAALTALGV